MIGGVWKIASLFLVCMCPPLVSGRGFRHDGNNHRHNVTVPVSSNYEDLMIEGDLRIRNFKDHRHRHRRRLGTIPTFQRWDNSYKNGYHWIRVYIDPTFPDKSRRKIKKSFRSLQKRAKVIKFKYLNDLPNRPADKTKKKKKRRIPFLKVLNTPEGCWSYIGRNWDAHEGQELSLEEGWCTDSRTIQHEIMHSLGFAHEHSRPDRDEHIEIIYKNIKPNYVDKFDVWTEVNSLEVPYDLNSIMHYSAYDYSIDPNPRASLPLPTIRPLHGKTIGSLKEASWRDILQLRLMYQCEKSVGARTQSEFDANPCTEQCQCWKNKAGCKNNDVLCKGDLVCHGNICRDPKDVVPQDDLVASLAVHPSSAPQSHGDAPMLSTPLANVEGNHT